MARTGQNKPSPRFGPKTKQFWPACLQSAAGGHLHYLPIQIYPDKHLPFLNLNQTCIDSAALLHQAILLSWPTTQIQRCNKQRMCRLLLTADLFNLKYNVGCTELGIPSLLMNPRHNPESASFIETIPGDQFSTNNFMRVLSRPMMNQESETKERTNRWRETGGGRE